MEGLENSTEERRWNVRAGNAHRIVTEEQHVRVLCWTMYERKRRFGRKIEIFRFLSMRHGREVDRRKRIDRIYLNS